MSHDEIRGMSRRQLLGAGCGALGLCLLAPIPALSYTAAPVPRPGRISGIIRYRGRRPRRPPPVKLSGDCAYCRKFDLRQESLLVAPGGGLRNTAVFLEGIKEGRAPPSALPVMAELRCTFVPHVLTVTAGNKILLHNQDPVLNTFHAVERSTGRTLFNIATPRKDQRVKRRIRGAGLIQMRCDVHPWEVAHIVSVAHPYHTVTDVGGAFALDGVPPGRFTLALWHEKLGGKRRTIQIGPGAHLKLVIDYAS